MLITDPVPKSQAGCTALSIEAKKAPAFFVVPEARTLPAQGGRGLLLGRFSDSGFHLAQGERKELVYCSTRASDGGPDLPSLTALCPALLATALGGFGAVVA